MGEGGDEGGCYSRPATAPAAYGEHELPAQGAEPRLEPGLQKDLDKGPKVRNIVTHHLYGDQLGGSLAETPHEHAQLVGQACYWSVGESRSLQPKATCHGATLFRQSAAGTRGCSGRVPCDHRRSACLPLLAPPHCTKLRLEPVRGCTASSRPPAHRLLNGQPAHTRAGLPTRSRPN